MKNISAKMQSSSREARNNQRRLLNAFGLVTDSDLLKFNQLKVSFLFHMTNPAFSQSTCVLTLMYKIPAFT